MRTQVGAYLLPRSNFSFQKAVSLSEQPIELFSIAAVSVRLTQGKEAEDGKVPFGQLIG